MEKTVKEKNFEQKTRLLKAIERLDEQEKRAQEIRLKLENIYGHIASGKATLAFEEAITEELLELKSDELLEQGSILEKRQDIEKSIADIEVQYTEAEKSYKHSLSQGEALTLRWKEWLKERDLNVAISTDGAIETIDIIRNSAETVNMLEQLREKKRSLENEKRNYCEKVNGLLSDCGRETVSDEKISQEINKLMEDYERDEQTGRNRDILTKELDLNKMTFEKLSRKISIIENEIKVLLNIVKAESEDAFRQNGKHFVERQRLLKGVEVHSANIKRLAGNPNNIDRILEEISLLKQNELEGDRARAEEKLKEETLILDRFKREHAQLEERVSIMVKDDQLSKLRAEEENLKQELEALSEEWITARFAKGLLSRSMARFEKERQPGVISEAGEFFKSMTLGRYSTIVAPLGENRIEVVDNANNRKTIDQLSRGTAEQLYLALRFGFIKEFSKRAEPMPIIMDEILVNFDRERAKATIRGITELSQNQQVFYFTCHPYVVDMFLEADGNIPVLEISEGQIIKN